MMGLPDWVLPSAEWAAVGFGLACVSLTVRQNIWCWPTGLVQVLLYIFVFLNARLYSDVVLHVIYVFMQIYGWWAWLRGGKDGAILPVSRLKPAMFAGWAGAGLVLSAGVGELMRRNTDADKPFWDAAILVFSLIAQWLMARKILESWIFWITIDVLGIGLYFVKELYPTAGLYAVFLVLAILGFLAWKKDLNVPAAA